MPVHFLVPREEYLAAGIHIGMKERTKHMQLFVYKVRPDGLAVMNLQTIDERIRTAAKFLARAKNMLVVSRKGVAHDAIKKFSEVVGAKAVKGRFMPGMLTNPRYENFYEADVVLAVDPMFDYQALKESATARIPVVAICDTLNETDNVDLIIPANNKGIRSITLLFWLLAREILKERGEIKSDKGFKHKIEDFTKRGPFRQERYERGRRKREPAGRESVRPRRGPARPRSRKR
jgi:small subunit ribosomal protein S2